METTPTPHGLRMLVTGILLLALLHTPFQLSAQCDTEVSGVFTYCNSVGVASGYMVAFRVKDKTGATLDVVDLTGQVPKNQGKRINDINTQQEPATVTVAQLQIAGGATDTLEFWYFGPFANNTPFDIALVDPTNTCDTIFVASGIYNCADNTGMSDPGACGATVPLFFLDFSQTVFQYGGGGGGNENFDEVFLIMQRSRVGPCCDLQPANQNCFEFIVQLADQDIGLAIDDVGSGSTAGEFYADTLNNFVCTGNTSNTWPFTVGGGQSSDLPLCLNSAAGELFVVLSCKSGNNVTGASVDAISGIIAPPEATIEPCNVSLRVFSADSVSWSSPDDPNLNNLISCNNDSSFCNFFYDVATFGEVTVCEGDTFIYIVAASPSDNECLTTDTILFDTTYVVVYPTFTVSIDTSCFGDELELSAIVSSVATGCEYAYEWSTGETTQSIFVPADGSEIFVTVTRADLPLNSQACVPAIDSILAIGGLSLDCSDVSDALFTCISELPDADTTIVTVTGCGTGDYLLYSRDISNGGAGCIGDTLVITRYYIVDFDGDTITTTSDRDTCTQIFEFVDNVAPSITCPGPVTVQCATLVPAPSTTAVVASDNCGGIPVVTFAGDVTTSQTCDNRLTLTRTYLATDDCGNTATCAQTITVFDNTPPLVTCPGPVAVTCTSQVPAANPGSVTVLDNCGGQASVTVAPDITTDITCANRLTLTRIYTATDVCGNSATCAQIITVFDDVPPSITCPANTSVACATLVPPANPGELTATDNCGGAVIITHDGDVQSNVTCDNNFTITRTYRATDLCGNTATCVQIISVNDNVPPSFMCPMDVSVECSDDVPAPATGLIATDNCLGSVSVNYLGETISNQTCDNRYTLTRTYVATDNCGNSATCQQIITVFDDTPPQLTCPGLVTVDCNEMIPPADPGSIDATDNCDGLVEVEFVNDITVNQTCAQSLTILRTYQATDVCGNTATCTQTIQVIDNIAPQLTCPSAVSVSCASEVPAANPDEITATDNCSGDVVVSWLNDVTTAQICENRFTIQRTYLATDPCGNSATCAQLIFVNDQTAPVINCQGDITVDCAGDIPDPDVDDVTVSDNCGGIPTVSIQDNTINQTCENQFTLVRTYTAMDECGNSATCARNITIFDDIPPTVTCPADRTVTCDSEVPPLNIDDVTVTDNCGGSVTILPASSISQFVCENQYLITRSYSATDACGNTATCTHTILVYDDVPPSITCPADLSILPTDDSSPDNTGNPTASDNCGGIPTITFDDVTVAGACVNDYTIIRTFTAIDNCNNTSTCIQTIEVEGPCNVDLALAKEVDPGQGSISGGDNVNYTITVINEGLVPVGSITITDYIPVGFTLNDPDWTAGTSGSTGQSATITLSIANGGLPPGGLLPTASVMVQITLQANPDIVPGIYINIAEITTVLDINGIDVSAGDTDSDPDDDDQNDPPGEDDISPAPICVSVPPVIEGETFVCSGDTVTYTVLNFNDAYTYVWTLPNGGGTILEDNGSNIVVMWTAPPGGPYTVMVEEIVGPDCSSIGILAVTIQGGEAIACLDHVNLSLGDECGTVILSGLILTGEMAGNNNYVVYVIDMNGDTVPNATLTYEHVGQTFKVSVVSTCSGQSCWGWLTVEDKFPPQMDCNCPVGNEDPECEINCTQIDEILSGNIPVDFYPTLEEDCGSVTVQVINIVLDYETCENGSILVTYKATDNAGNTNTCVQQLNIIPLTIEGLEFPGEYIGDCDDSTDPSNTGWPTVDGFNLTDIPGHCNILVTYNDLVFDLCGGGRKIMRTWRVFDWCVPAVEEFIQFIILEDRQGPELICPADLTVNTSVWFCYASPIIPKPLAADACSDIKTYQLYSPEGEVQILGNLFRVNELPVGTHTLVWTVTDECHNSSTCSFNVTVVDNVPPVMACKEHLVVSLTNDRPDGITFIPVSAFDDGNLDNCSTVQLRARRMTSCIDFDWTTNGACADDTPNGIINGYDEGTWHADCVPFSCCDIGGEPIMVEVEATDAAGNVNYCMVEVNVQDKLPPVVITPPNITISCTYPFNITTGLYLDDNHNGLLEEDPLSEFFGNILDANLWKQSDRQEIIINDPANTLLAQPYNWGIDGWATDNCELDLQVTVTYTEDCSGAGLPGSRPENAVGLITRRFVAKDKSGNTGGSMMQRIWIVDFTPFYISDTTCNDDDPLDGVIWPCDVMFTDCQNEISGTGEPILLEDNCSLVGVTYKDTRYDLADGSCFKILREWKVIDWCQYNSSTGAGYWTYTQTIKVVDGAGPEFVECPVAPVTLCLDDPGITLPSNNQIFLGENDPNASNCTVHVTMSQTVEEFCSDHVLYDVKIYPFNGSEFIQIKPSTVLELDADHRGVMTFNTQESTMISIAQEGLPYNDASCGDYHRVVWTVEDGCGNINFCDYLFRLEDCKKPTPVCHNGLSTVVMGSNGEVTIWASDFNASSYDDCTSSDELIFSFSGTEYQPSFTYNCDNVPEFGEPLAEEIWVADGGADDNCNGIIEWSERNIDVCVTYIVITDNSGACQEMGLVLEGEIFTEHTEAVGQVSVNLSSPNGSPAQVITAVDGKYIFDDLVSGRDYNIVPKRNDDHKNGVTTLDLVRIQKHLLGREPFTSGYQYIAADANNSQTVSAIDLIEIRKLILGLYEEFPNNQSWRFIRNTGPMTPGYPWPFEEQISIDDFDPDDVDQLDFTGVKIGDVNATAKANANQIVTRNANRLVTIGGLVKGEIREGELVDIKLILPENLEGFQWTLELQGLSLTDVRSSDLPIDMSNVGIHTDGTVTMSWNGDAKTNELGYSSIILTFLVNQVSGIEEMIRMSSRITPAEAYALNEEIVDVNLSFNSHIVFTDFALHQNKPNPWSGQTLIGFDLPEEGDAKLTVYDVTGKVVKEVNGHFKSGYNTIRLTSRDIPTPGMLYYRLESGVYSATKKMMIIR